jgi:hypothetical protein
MRISYQPIFQQLDRIRFFLIFIPIGTKSASHFFRMAKKSDPEAMLKELAELDKRLARLQKFFRESKSATAEGSLLTPKNIEETIRLLEKINPSEKAMIQALKMLLPLSKQSNAAIEKKTAVKRMTMPLKETSHNACTAKIKGRLMPGRMI